MTRHLSKAPSGPIPKGGTPERRFCAFQVLKITQCELEVEMDEVEIDGD
jgi:hypothetical protein